jgi:hypothetical protein
VEVIFFDRSNRIVNLADDENAGPVARRVAQFQRPRRIEDVAFTVFRRLVVDDGLQPSGDRRVQHLPADFDFEEHVEEAVGVAGRERIDVQPARIAVNLLGDAADARPTLRCGGV